MTTFTSTALTIILAMRLKLSAFAASILATSRCSCSRITPRSRFEPGEIALRREIGSLGSFLHAVTTASA